MKEFVFVVKDPSGVHARPAGLLVKEAGKYESLVKIECNEKTADAKRIFSVMSLGAKCGDSLKFVVEGADEEKASESLKVFLDNNL